MPFERSTRWNPFSTIEVMEARLARVELTGGGGSSGVAGDMSKHEVEAAADAAAATLASCACHMMSVPAEIA